MRCARGFVKFGLMVLMFGVLTIAGIAQTKYTWSVSSGDWNVSSNWNPPGVPGPADSAVVNSGAVTLSVDAEVGGFSLTGGILNGDGKLTVTGLALWAGGKLEGSDSLVVAPGAALRISGGNVKELNTRSLLNRGNGIWSGAGKIGLRNGALLLNDVGASFEIQNDANIESFIPGGGSFINAGAILKSAGSSTSLIDVAFSTTGPITINSGAMMLKKNSSLGGTAVTVGAGSEFEFNGAAHTLDNVIFEGGGTVEIVNAALAVSGAAATFAPGLTLTLRESNAILSAGAPITVNGNLLWERGTIQGPAPITVNGALDISGTNARKLDGAALRNNGAAAWSGSGAIKLVNGAALRNEAGATFDLAVDAIVEYLEPGGGSFLNYGTLAKNGGNGPAAVKVYFENHGTANIASGAFQLTKGGLHSDAVFNIAAGALLDFNGGNQALEGVVFSGNGSVKFSKDNITVDGDGVAIQSGVTATMSAAKLQCDEDLTIQGVFYWTNGVITGSEDINARGEFHFSGNDFKDLNGLTINNYELMTWSGSGAIKLKNSAKIVNKSGATFDIQSDALMDYVLADNGGSFENKGVMAKSAGSGISYIDAVFVNTGDVNAHSGTLRFERGSPNNSTGDFHTTSGNTLVFAERSFAFNNADFTGNGTVRIEDATLLINSSGLDVSSSVTVNMDNNLAVIDGEGTLLVKGALNWGRGVARGTGELKITGKLNFSGDYFRTLNGKILNNLGDIVWSGPGAIRLENFAQIVNQPGAVFEIHNDAAINFVAPNGGSIQNFGVFLKKNSVGLSTVGVDFTNAGVTVVESGILKFTHLLSNESGGEIRGNGTLDLAAAQFVNNGTLSPGMSPGVLSVAGAYAQSPGGALNVELAGLSAGSQYDRLAVSGTASLNGALNITLAQNFLPAEGDEFSILTHASRNGEFSEVNGPAIAGYPMFEVNYEPGGVTLTAVRLSAGLTAVNDYAATPEDQGASLNVLRNDNASIGNHLSITGHTSPAHGTAAQVGDSSFSYLPAANFFGLDSFFYSITDESGAADNARVLIEVQPVNDPPAITSPLPDLAFPEDGSAVLNLANRASDVDNTPAQLSWSAEVIAAQSLNTMKLSVVSRPSSVVNPQSAIFNLHSSIEIDPEDLQIAINPAAQIAVFSATGDSSGVFTVVFTVSDPGGLWDSDTITVTVSAAGDPPFVANPIPDLEFPEDGGPVTAAANLHEVFSDPDPGAALSFSALSVNPGIQPAVQGASLTVSSSPNFFGGGSVIVSANDGTRTVASDTFTVTVTPVNDPPALVSSIADLVFPEDSGTHLAVSNLNEAFSDPDSGDVLSFSAVSGNSAIQAAIQGASLWVSAAANYFGGGTVLVSASDGQFSASDTFIVTVTPVNDPPAISGLPDVTFPEDGSYSLDLDEWVSDADNDPAELSWSAQVIGAQSAERIAHGAGRKPSFSEERGTQGIEVDTSDLQISIDPLTHTAMFTTTTDSAGIFTVKFTVSDPQGLADADTMLVTVTGANDPPALLNPIPDLSFPEDSGPQIAAANLNAVFFDPDPGSAFIFSAASDNPDILAWVQNDSLWVNGTLNYFGEGSVVVTAHDGEFAASDTFTVTITPVNDPPTLISPIADITFPEDGGPRLVAASLAAIFHDPDPGAGLSFSASSDNPDIQALLAGDSLLVASSLNYFGNGRVSVVAYDDGGLTATDTFTVTILPVNDPPEIAGLPDSLSLPPDSSASLSLWDFVEDVETPDSLLSFTFSASNNGVFYNYHPGNGTLVLSATPGFLGEMLLSITAADPEGAFARDTLRVVVNAAVGIGELPGGEIPVDFALEQNYPNPFNPGTAISFQLSAISTVELKIYDVAGRLVRTLVSENKAPGSYTVQWDGRDDRGAPVASGVYLYRLEAGSYRAARKMVLMR